jgi:hypothetical protein
VKINLLEELTMKLSKKKDFLHLVIIVGLSIGMILLPGCIKNTTISPNNDTNTNSESVGSKPIQTPTTNHMDSPNNAQGKDYYAIKYDTSFNWMDGNTSNNINIELINEISLY